MVIKRLLGLFLSLILGLVFGVIIGKIIIPSKIYHGPYSGDMKKKIFKDSNGECYQMVPKIHICPIKKSMKLF